MSVHADSLVQCRSTGGWLLIGWFSSSLSWGMVVGHLYAVYRFTIMMSTTGQFWHGDDDDDDDEYHNKCLFERRRVPTHPQSTMQCTIKGNLFRIRILEIAIWTKILSSSSSSPSSSPSSPSLWFVFWILETTTWTLIWSYPIWSDIIRI